MGRGLFMPVVVVVVKGKCSTAKRPKSMAHQCLKNVSGVMVMVILRYPQLLHTGRFLSASRICMSEHGPATGSHFWSYWWIFAIDRNRGLKLPLRLQPAFVMIRAIFRDFAPLNLLLSEVVVYASNHALLRLNDLCPPCR